MLLNFCLLVFRHRNSLGTIQSDVLFSFKNVMKLEHANMFVPCLTDAHIKNHCQKMRACVKCGSLQFVIK